jgi:hypothetical protein
VTSDALSDLTSMSLSLRCRQPAAGVAPSSARAWLSWKDGEQIHTASSWPAQIPASAAWSNLTLPLTRANGSPLVPEHLAGKTFLLEVQFYGAPINGSALNIDEVILCTTHALSIAPDDGVSGMVGQRFTKRIPLTGGTAPYVWSIMSGSLPPGLSLNATTGTISGIPNIDGNSEFVLSATDANGVTARRFFSLRTLAARLVIRPIDPTAKLPIKLSATGGRPPYTWNLNRYSGANGLLVTHDGYLVGNSWTGGQSAIRVDVRDSRGDTTTEIISLQSNIVAGDGLSITPPSLPPAYAGEAYRVQLNSATGWWPLVWTMETDDLPTGISLSQSGLLSVNLTQPGRYPIVIRVSDQQGRRGTHSYELIAVEDTRERQPSYALWKQATGIVHGMLSDSDGDQVPNLMEYALGLPPDRGTAYAGRLFLQRETRTDGSPAVGMVIRHLQTELNDVSLSVEVRSSLTDATRPWIKVGGAPTREMTSDGLIQLTYSDLAASLGSPSEMGFTRERVDWDSDHDGSPEITAFSTVWGWHQLQIPARSPRAVGLSFTTPAVAVARAWTIARHGITLVSDGSFVSERMDVGSLMTDGRQYYCEILSGALAGHRFEINEGASHDNYLEIVINHPANTLRFPPRPGLADGPKVALRPHWTVATAFPASQFPGESTPATADDSRLAISNGGRPPSWPNGYGPEVPEGYNLHSDYDHLRVRRTTGSPSWILYTVTQDDRRVELPGDRLAIPADSGIFVHPPSDAPLTLLLLGQVRDTPFAHGTQRDRQMFANPWPIRVTPAKRAMLDQWHFDHSSADVPPSLVKIYPNGNPQVPNINYRLVWTPTSKRWEPEVAGSPPLVFEPSSAATLSGGRYSSEGWVEPVPWTP